MRSLLIKILRVAGTVGLGVLLIYIGFNRFVTTEGFIETVPRLLAAFGLMGVGAVLIAPTVAGIIAAPWGGVYYSREKLWQDERVYGKPLLLHRQKRFHEAIREYQKIGKRANQSWTPYMAMIEIAIKDLGNEPLGMKFLEEGLARTRSRRGRKLLKAKYAYEFRHRGGNVALAQPKKEEYKPKILLDTDIDELEKRLEKELREKKAQLEAYKYEGV